MDIRADINSHKFSEEYVQTSDLKARFEGILEIDRTMRPALGISFLCHEFRLILQLYVKNHLSVKDAALSSRLSSRAFYELLRRLEREGVLRFEQNPADRRSKAITLDDAFIARLRTHFVRHSSITDYRDQVLSASQAANGLAC